MKLQPECLIISRIVLDDIHHSETESDSGILGGSGFWAAFGAALVTDEVAVTCKVGADFQEYFPVLERLGIRLDGLVRVPGPTSRTVVTYPEHEERHEEPLPDWDYHVAMRTVAQEFPSSVSSPRSIYVFRAQHQGFWEGLFEITDSTIPILWEIPGAVCNSENVDWVKTILPHVTVLSLNEEEAKGLTGTQETQDQLEALHVLGARTIVLRRGALGSAASDGTQIYYSAPPKTTRVIDVTGAGNSFSGAFIAAWHKSHGDIRFSTAAGMAASAVAIGQIGPPESLEQGRDLWQSFMNEINVSGKQV